MRRIVLLLLIIAMFFSVCAGCVDEEDDDPSCESAVDNAYSKAEVQTLCETGYIYADWSYTTYQECLEKSISDIDEETVKNDLVAWCRDKWSISDIECQNDAESDADVRKCAGLDE